MSESLYIVILINEVKKEGLMQWRRKDRNTDDVYQPAAANVTGQVNGSQSFVHILIV